MADGLVFGVSRRRHVARDQSTRISIQVFDVTSKKGVHAK